MTASLGLPVSLRRASGYPWVELAHCLPISEHFVFLALSVQPLCSLSPCQYCSRPPHGKRRHSAPRPLAPCTMRECVNAYHNANAPEVLQTRCESASVHLTSELLQGNSWMTSWSALHHLQPASAGSSSPPNKGPIAAALSLSCQFNNHRLGPHALRHFCSCPSLYAFHSLLTFD
ncbi:hypothetical protein K504DRAFT_243918 [Pleomassaria siparia CBS 279.74]|uniref:Uncharacterized protein n=1 Tax=Pleomassaria siparia CBS 279.74 TaxID=1314801 RepID=A0A6G1KFK3_9PLEO|nr:hypothetical protein K504DRAFT_243918 [Pleomassaria siparia CBS 279.74]